MPLLKRVEPSTENSVVDQNLLSGETRDDERGPTIEELLEIFRRRKVALFVPTILVFAAAVALAWSLPELYRSTATILIEQQEIPPDLVRTTVTSYADERIQTITQRVLTTSNLQRIVEKFNLYPELRAEAPIGVVADRVRRGFNVNRVSAQSGRFQSTIAFNVSYDSSSPAVAQAVTTELTSLYLEENLKTRTESAADTTGFLRAEADRLGDEISALEVKIAAFKQLHMGRLPEQLGLNLQLMARTEQQIGQIEQQIRSLEDRKIYLETAMAQLRASAQGAPNQIAEQLKALRSQLNGMLAIYTPDHPDVKRLRAEMETLEKQLDNQAVLSAVRDELKKRRAELAQALKSYSPEHPEAISLQRQVFDLEAALEETKIGVNTSSTEVSAGTGYLDFQAQHRAADKEIAALRSDRSELHEKLASYEKRVSEIPEIEREYSLLVRDRDNLLGKYQEIRAKLSSARVAENLERARKGERFSLIEPARRPVKPFKPNRKKILSLGLIGAIGAGVGTAIISELLHKAVHGVRGVTALLGMPPLAVIPYIEGPVDRRRRFMKWVLIVFLTLAFLGAAGAFVHFQIAALDEFWAQFRTSFDAVSAALMERFAALLER